MRPITTQAWFCKSSDYYRRDTSQRGSNNPHIHHTWESKALQNPAHQYSIFTYPSPWWESSFNKRIQLQFLLNCLPGEPYKLRVQHRSHSARNCTKLSSYWVSHKDVTEKMIVLFLNVSRLRAEAGQGSAAPCTLHSRGDNLDASSPSKKLGTR
jgi:hypothetical protein